ncbi:MAG: pseudouridine-5'-phosphate glycosidase [Phycisphaerales bacterium]|nr:pseudouridine-5'-phosphate glycosidase [Phycisphaerales bacterium]
MSAADSLINRAGPGAVALETTLLAHGIPPAEAPALQRDLGDIIRAEGAEPALIGVCDGRMVAGMTDGELAAMLATPEVPKLNTANLGLALHRRGHGATTVSATMEISALAGIRVFATGGLGGVHAGYGEHLDISADLAAFTRFPVAVVTAGVKSILDVAATREALETLGIPVIGWRTRSFPAFYLRDTDLSVDATFTEMDDLAAYVRRELTRTGRGVVIANPVPEADELDRQDWDAWLTEARRRSAGVTGRGATPALLGALHELSGGETLRCNLALVRHNARVAGALCHAMQNTNVG